jgi:hypothetical protein
VEDKFKRNNFLFGKKFDCPTEFELENQEKTKLNLVVIYKGLKPLRKNPINSPKISPGRIFMNMNLY